MILRELFSFVVAGFFICIIGAGFFSHFFLGHDNKIEEVSEEMIYDETGIDMDLTPSSKEK